MLQSAENFPVRRGRIEGGFEDHRGWIPVPVEPTTLQARFYLGDPVSGPLVWLFFGHPADPAKAEPSPERPPPPHHHRTPTFRIALGEQPRQMLLNNRWHGKGEYFLLDANHRYADPNGVAGFSTLLIFADRRGMHPAMKRTVGMSSDELIAWNGKLFAPLGAGLAALHTADDQAVGGVAVEPGGEIAYGQARGSLEDPSGWTRLADGSRVSAVLMGDTASGPAVVMSVNTPGAREAPAGRCAGDAFRLVTKGSCRVGDRVYAAGAFVATEAGTEVGEVVHGAEGSTQLLILADRRRLAPLDATGAPAVAPRLNEVAAVLAGAGQAPAKPPLSPPGRRTPSG